MRTLGLAPPSTGERPRAMSERLQWECSGCDGLMDIPVKPGTLCKSCTIANLRARLAVVEKRISTASMALRHSHDAITCGGEVALDAVQRVRDALEGSEG